MGVTGAGGTSRRHERAPITPATAPAAASANHANSPLLVASRSITPTVPDEAPTAVPPIIKAWAWLLRAVYAR